MVDWLYFFCNKIKTSKKKMRSDQKGKCKNYHQPCKGYTNAIKDINL